MKKLLLIVILSVGCSLWASRIWPATLPEGFISNVVYTPLQISMWFENGWRLFDGKAHCLLAWGILGNSQQSALVSFAPVNGICNNYFCQVGLLTNLGSANWGIAAAPVNVCENRNYGLQFGCVNWNAFNDWGVQTGLLNFYGMIQLGFFNEDGRMQVGLLNKTGGLYGNIGYPVWQVGLINGCQGSVFQLGTINDGGKVQVGVANVARNSLFQFGLINDAISGLGSGDMPLQIGLINHNPQSYIPWLPFVNWSMKQESANDSE